MGHTEIQQKKQWLAGPDAVRIAACFLVVSVHFFYNNGFYRTPVIGGRMAAMVFMRSYFMICVPLFILLTGYLMRKQQLGIAYYAKIKKTLIIYLLASTACILFRIFYSKEKPDIFWGYLSFSGAPYAWYIEMYIGLFLLIPFLNLAYNGIKTKKGKLVLIATCLLLTSLPAMLNIYNFSTDGWWSDPTVSTSYQKLVPAWWTGIYPLTYYFIGAFIGEFQVKLNRKLNLGLIVLCAGLCGLYAWWRSRGTNFITGVWNTYSSLFVAANATLLFIFLIHKDYSKRPAGYKKALRFLSGLTLGAYLLSYIFDKLFYPILAKHVPDVPDKLPYYLIIVPAVFVCSVAGSFVLEMVYKLAELLIGKLPKRKKKTEKELITQ